MSAKVAIVTASGQGIGAGIARSFAAAGYRVALMSLSDRGVRAWPRSWAGSAGRARSLRRTTSGRWSTRP